jgi:DNA-binding response OmpR family regulator
MQQDILEGATIVLLEDDEFLAEVIVRKLTTVGAKITRYRNGLEGLAAIRQLNPDLVLLDIMMPIMNGYEVLEIMKQEKLIDEIPIIVVSNSGQPVEIERVLKLGVRDYVVKVDFTPDEVLSKARIVLTQVGKKTRLDAQKLASSSAVSTTNIPQMGAVAASTPDKTLSELKVLVVEDDPLLKNLLAVKLTASGCLPLYVDDGLKVFSLAETFKPDVILLDLMIPGMDGFGVLEQLGKSPELKNVPVFVFSNKSSEEDKARAFALGAKLFRQKAETSLTSVVQELYLLAGKQQAT